MRLLCFGYGYVAQRLASVAHARGFEVLGTTRDGRGGMLRYNGQVIEPALELAIAASSHLLISIPPYSQENALAAAIMAMARQARWIGYLSTTGVYGDAKGGVVGETTRPDPLNARSRARMDSEILWRQNAAHIFRLSGIYGPGRSAFDAIAQGHGQRVHKPGHAFNRIHVDDIARALLASMQAPTPGSIYNLSDDLPAAQADVMGYAYRLLGATPPAPVAFEQAALSTMGRSFYAGSRRVDATKIKRCHGLNWMYPTYRQGLAAILQEECIKKTREDNTHAA